MRITISIVRSILRLMAAFTAMAALSAAAQPSTAMEKANQLFQAKNWAAAAPAFEQITASEPAVALAWMRLGVSRHKLEQFEQAIQAYRHIESHPQLGPSALYREAASYARLKNKEQSLALLARSIDAGLAAPATFRQDEDLAWLRGDPAFEKLMARAEELATPCAHAPEYRQFDYWLGEWAVETTQGAQKAGDSSIQSILGQCVLLENWSGAGGGNGKSLNHYDAQKKIWIQDWVDAVGGAIHFEGKLEDGVMSFYADSQDPDGSPVRRHLQFFKLDANRVRQFSQRSKDGGKTWTPEYDFTYVRKKY
jgi:tetratricopeptide (TPR) repeat protein